MPKHLDELKEQVIPILLNAGVTCSAVFGSFARGDARPESDIDLLVDFPRGKSLFDFLRLQFQLEDKLHRKVDLVDFTTLKPRLRDRILQSKVDLLP